MKAQRKNEKKKMMMMKKMMSRSESRDYEPSRYNLGSYEPCKMQYQENNLSKPVIVDRAGDKKIKERNVKNRKSKIVNNNYVGNRHK